MKIFMILPLCLISTPAFSLTCQNDYAGSSGCASNSSAAGDCETLGFSTIDIDGCNHYLRCPFDLNYKRCASNIKQSCPELGFTSEDKTSWCSAVIPCPTDSTYSLCAGIEKCTDYPLSECPTGAICDSCTVSGSALKYKLISCSNGYVLEDDTCIGANCTGYNLSQCPTNGTCTSCLSGTETKYMLNSCAYGWKVNTAKTSCIEKTCEDYGYQTMNLGYMVCDGRYSVKIGSLNAYCYSQCKVCGLDIEPGSYTDIEAMCFNNPDDCFISTTSSHGYNYGSCTTYESDYECTTGERCSDYVDWY